MRIGICDDDKEICINLERLIKDVAAFREECYDISIFNSGEALIKDIENNGGFDIIFLDIQMEDLSGIDVGHIIRDRMLDEETKLIYVSSIKDYAMDLFDVRAMQFLIKPLDEEKVKEVLIKTLNIINKNIIPFEYKIGKRVYVTPISDIVYFESLGKKVKLVTTCSQVEFYGSITEIAKNNFDSFVQIHRSYLVNFKYINSYSHTDITITDGQTIPIGSDRRDKVAKKLFDLTRSYMKGE